MAQLPYDILFLVLSECSPPGSSTVVRLSGVCQRWREVAFGSPKLWCNLTLRLSAAVTRGILERLRQKAKLWIANSGTEMIDIKIEYGEHLDLLLHLLSFVLPAARRWNDISFTGIGDLSVGATSGWFVGQCETLTIDLVSTEWFSPLARFGARWARPPRTSPTNALDTTPNIKLAFPRRSQFVKKIPIGPITEFTSLAITSDDPSFTTWVEDMDILRSFPRLQRLLFEARNSRIRSSSQHHRLKPIRVPSLLELHLWNLFEDTSECLLTQLDLPNLQSLFLHHMPVADSLVFLGHFLTKPALTKLVLNRVFFGHNEFQKLIKDLGSLAVLELDLTHGIAGMCGAIGPDPDNLDQGPSDTVSYPLPFLLTLSFATVNDQGSVPDLVRMVINREKAGARKLAIPMERLDVSGCRFEEKRKGELRAILGGRLVA